MDYGGIVAEDSEGFWAVLVESVDVIVRNEEWPGHGGMNGQIEPRGFHLDRVQHPLNPFEGRQAGLQGYR